MSAYIRLFTAARSLTYLDISRNEISRSKNQQRLVNALTLCPAAKHLATIKWNEDIKLDKEGKNAIEKFSQHMPKLRTLELKGCIRSKSARNFLKAKALGHNLQLMLTDADDVSESESEKEESDGEDMSSESFNSN